MKLTNRLCVPILLSIVFGVLLSAGPSVSQTSQSPSSGLPSEMPAEFTPVTSSFDFTRRDVMIPMRDGVKLPTVILIPKGARNAPILLTRTPYDATALTSHSPSSHLGPVLQG